VGVVVFSHGFVVAYFTVPGGFACAVFVSGHAIGAIFRNFGGGYKLVPAIVANGNNVPAVSLSRDVDFPGLVTGT